MASYTITATHTDEAGNISPESSSVIFTVDTTVEPPVITGPADGSTIGDSTPTVTGTGEPGATVEVSVDGVVVGTTEVTADGRWSLDLADPLADGEHTISAVQTDPAGNTSVPAESTFTVDGTTPAAPVITGPEDGTTITDSTPAITGTGEPGATVEVTVDGVVVGETTVNPDGTWSLDLADPLADGEHTVSAIQTDAAGNISAPSEEISFTVDATGPDAPVITGPEDGSTVGDDTPAITGTGEPGATVEVTVDGVVVGETTVNPDGTWSLDLADPLADGEHTVTATETDAAGNTSPADEVTFTVDTTVDAPVIESPASGSTTNDATPTISGTGTPGATVTVTAADGTELGSATVDADGNWSFDVATELADGSYTITATQTDASGNVSPESSSVIFTVDTTAPAPPTIISPADGSSVSDSTPTITGTGEPGATVEVSVDGEVVGRAEVGADGNWRLVLAEPLAPGRHVLTATQTDAAGNTSTPSEPIEFTLTEAAPGPPPGDGGPGGGPGGGGQPSPAPGGGGGGGLLPTTGAPVNLVVLGLLGLVAISGGLLLFRRPSPDGDDEEGGPGE